ncbi:radical SAM protein [Pyrobaculum aerophilum]|uniref:radical SAM protein n=1 Tax=Pyrobaculum aerophilum TaxID=13773 RepID=UPI0023EF56DD|nr:radical SAM protein [Pyrobaculum aerophilum]MCX8136425.1 radical SAM protein [Pyrobaculum aerophilum]
MYSYKCNFLCKHCSVGAGPFHDELLPIETIEKVLDQAYFISSIKVVAAAGGEPTLYLSHLRTLLKKAADLSFITRVVTNAWWASTPQRAYHFLDDLRALGLEELNISYDDFHDEWLSRYGGWRNIVNAVRAAVDLGLRTVIAVVRAKNSLITANVIRERLKLEGLDNKVLILEDFLSPTSRAKGLETVINVSGYGCGDVGHLSVHPNGDVAFCCGHIINDPESGWFTRIGNIYREISQTL